MNATGPIVWDMHISRISRQEFGISGTVTIGQPEKDGATMDAIAMYRPKADGPYTMTPFRVPRKSICDLLEEYYVKITMKDMKDCSDLPQVEEGDPELCNMFMGVSALKNCVWQFDVYKYYSLSNFCWQNTFTVTNYVIDPKPVPNMLQKGFYKLYARVFDKDVVLVSGVELIVQLS